MKVKERLRHGTTFTVVLLNATLLLTPSLAVGQIIEAADPYGGDKVARPGLEETPVAETTAPTSQSTASEQVQLAYLRVRQFIAQGNTAEAERYLAMIPENHPGVLGDTRETATGLIDRQRQLAAMRTKETPGFDEQAVQFLLSQARDVLKFRDFATAEMLLNQAQLFSVDFSKMPISPASVQAAIAQAKNPGIQPDSTANRLMSLMSQAQLAFDQNQYQKARQLVYQAQKLGVPENQLPPHQVRPWQLDLKIQDALKTKDQVVPVSFEKVSGDNVVQADYYPETDTTRNVAVSATAPVTNMSAVPPSIAFQQYQAGVQAMQNNDRPTARKYFSAAWKNRKQLDQATEQALEEQLQSLVEPVQGNEMEEIPPGDNLTPANVTQENFQAPANVAQPVPNTTGTLQQPMQTPAGGVQQNIAQEMSRDLATDAQQEQLFRRLQSEVFRQRATAEQLGKIKPTRSHRNIDKTASNDHFGGDH